MRRQPRHREEARALRPACRKMKDKNFNDWAVALAVIACSILLLLALAFALSGRTMGQPSGTLRINFHDITGISLGSQIKYAGAIAGKVSGIRMLSSKERADSGDPLNAIQVALALNSGVPPLSADITASIAADTLLSDKFILLSGGSSNSPPLPADAVLQGISPIAFDKLSRDIDVTIEGLRNALNGTEGEPHDFFERLRLLLTETQSLLTEARPVIEDAKALAADARQLVADNRIPISQAVSQLANSASAFEKLAASGNRLVVNNEKKLTATISDFKVTSENLKITATYAKILIRSLSQRPSQLIWGNSKPPVLPSEQEILRSSAPLPAN
jgi:ABC-type transporter Mla subunit MlaD